MAALLSTNCARIDMSIVDEKAQTQRHLGLKMREGGASADLPC